MKSNFNYCGKLLILILLASFPNIYLNAQTKLNDGKTPSISTEPFGDSMRHWYGIHDDNNIVNPVANQPKYQETDYTKIADNILLFQRNNGGWPKNYDMKAILTPAQVDSVVRTKNKLHTTFDNSTTYTHIQYLAQVYTATKIEKYKDACLKGIDFILTSQYPNGGWPQYFPIEKDDYSRRITFNDGAYIGIIKTLKMILDNDPDFAFIGIEVRRKVKLAYEKGLECILKMQIVDNGKLTAWCQQHDEVDLSPAWARAFEPPSICNGESAPVVLFLMKIDHPGDEIIESVQSAVKWFQDSKIYNTKVITVPAPAEKSQWKTSWYDKVVVTDSTAPPIWTRYYELGTDKPLFCDRNSKFLYSMAEVSRERRSGYGWYTYAPQEVLDKYPEWQKKISVAQTVEENYRKPLKDVLKEVETRFNVKLGYNEKLVADRSVNYAQWRFKDDVEATLQAVLGPLDLVFSKSGEGNYKIEAFQYHRRSPDDGRKHLDRLLSLYPALQDWETRKAGVQKCMLSTLGISPLPEKTPLNPVYANKRTLNGYIAENVAIESLPGVFVSGTLYRPIKGKGPFPAVMVAQGHGEIQHYGESSQLLSATLARMGAVVFSYDMFAKGEESLQFAFEDHRTGLAMTMQTMNSIRILDFLCSLPYVDPKRIGMTGASGGGTQTFLMTALDSRIAVSVPVVMVSSWFFGGCPCESGMPIHSCGEWGTNNVEIAAMAAPRPMLVVSDGGDWTANVPEIEFPYLKKVYSLFGKPELVENVHLEKEGHDYGPSKRQAVYKFLAKKLELNIESVKAVSGEVDESKSTIESKSAMLVFGENGERLPAHAIHGIEVLKAMLKK